MSRPRPRQAAGCIKYVILRINEDHHLGSKYGGEHRSLAVSQQYLKIAKHILTSTEYYEDVMMKVAVRAQNCPVSQNRAKHKTVEVSKKPVQSTQL